MAHAICVLNVYRIFSSLSARYAVGDAMGHAVSFLFSAQRDPDVSGKEDRSSEGSVSHAMGNSAQMSDSSFSSSIKVARIAASIMREEKHDPRWSTHSFLPRVALVTSDDCTLCGSSNVRSDFYHKRKSVVDATEVVLDRRHRRRRSHAERTR